MRIIRLTITIVSCWVLATACGGRGGSTATTPSSAVPSSKSSASTPTPGETVNVDITISGASTATVKGTKGRCQRGNLGTSYDFEGADYPDLGPNGAFSLTTDIRLGTQVEGPTIKVVVGSDGYITGADVSGIDINPERTAVNLDQTITSSTGVDGPARTIKISGTIRCG